MDELGIDTTLEDQLAEELTKVNQGYYDDVLNQEDTVPTISPGDTRAREFNSAFEEGRYNFFSAPRNIGRGVGRTIASGAEALMHNNKPPYNFKELMTHTGDEPGTGWLEKAVRKPDALIDLALYGGGRAGLKGGAKYLNSKYGKIAESLLKPYIKKFGLEGTKKILQGSGVGKSIGRIATTALKTGIKEAPAATAYEMYRDVVDPKDEVASRSGMPVRATVNFGIDAALGGAGAAVHEIGRGPLIKSVKSSITHDPLAASYKKTIGEDLEKGIFPADPHKFRALTQQNIDKNTDIMEELSGPLVEGRRKNIQKAAVERRPNINYMDPERLSSGGTIDAYNDAARGLVMEAVIKDNQSLRYLNDITARIQKLVDAQTPDQVANYNRAILKSREALAKRISAMNKEPIEITSEAVDNYIARIKDKALPDLNDEMKQINAAAKNYIGGYKDLPQVGGLKNDVNRKLSDVYTNYGFQDPKTAVADLTNTAKEEVYKDLQLMPRDISNQLYNTYESSINSTAGFPLIKKPIKPNFVSSTNSGLNANRVEALKKKLKEASLKGEKLSGKTSTVSIDEFLPDASLLPKGGVDAVNIASLAPLVENMTKEMKSAKFQDLTKKSMYKSIIKKADKMVENLKAISKGTSDGELKSYVDDQIKYITALKNRDMNKSVRNALYLYETGRPMDVGKAGPYAPGPNRLWSGIIAPTSTLSKIQNATSAAEQSKIFSPIQRYLRRELGRKMFSPDKHNAVIQSR